jgi:hypothetical protein
VRRSQKKEMGKLLLLFTAAAPLLFLLLAHSGGGGRVEARSLGSALPDPAAEANAWLLELLNKELGQLSPMEQFRLLSDVTKLLAPRGPDFVFPGGDGRRPEPPEPVPPRTRTGRRRRRGKPKMLRDVWDDMTAIPTFGTIIPKGRRQMSQNVPDLIQPQPPSPLSFRGRAGRPGQREGLF